MQLIFTEQAERNRKKTGNYPTSEESSAVLQPRPLFIFLEQPVLTGFVILVDGLNRLAV